LYKLKADHVLQALKQARAIEKMQEAFS
jgi:hypothetical protein